MDRKNDIHENGEDRKLKAYAGKKMPYDVPEGYFEELPATVLARIHDTQKKHPGLRKLMIRMASAAAVLTLLTLAAVHFLTNNGAEFLPEEAFSVEDIYQYSLDNMAELEDIYLISYIDDHSIDLSDLMKDESDSISDEAIMEYLLAENHIEYYIINEY